MSINGCKKFKRIAVSFAILGLLFQAALVAVSIPSAFAAGIPKDLPAGYTSIVICTGAGMERIVIDADGNRIEPEDQKASAEYCSACTLVDTPAFAINAVAPQNLTAGYHSPYRVLGNQVSEDRLYAQCPDSRGPPLKI